MNNSKDDIMDGMNINPIDERIRSNPDPIIQERDCPDDGSCKGNRASEIVLAPEETIAVPRMTTGPHQFMGTSRPAQAVMLMSDILRPYLRYKWMILAVFVLVAAPIIAAVWTQISPVYTAKGELRIRPIIPHLVFRTEDSGPVPFYNSFVNTQVSMMLSPVILQRVLDDPAVKETKWYKDPVKSLRQRLTGYIPPRLTRLRYSLSAQPRRGTEIVDITFTNTDPKTAALIVNTVLKHYMKYYQETSEATEDNLYSELQTQYKSLENEILGLEKGTAELQKSLSTKNVSKLIHSRRIRLDEKEDDLSEIQQEITLLEWKIKRFSGDSNDVAFVENSEIQPKYDTDPEWRSRDINVRTLRHQIANSGLTSKHPDRIRMVKDLEFAEELLRLRQAQVDEQWSHRPLDDVPREPVTVAQWRGQPINVIGAPIATTMIDTPGFGGGLASLKSRLAQAQLSEQLMSKELEKQQADYKRLTDIAQLLEGENAELKHKRNLFDAVRQRLDQKRIERNVPGKIDLGLAALAPTEPSGDRRVPLTAMALIMGLGLGGGIAFLLISRNQIVYALKDMPYPMQVPFLGHVPVTHVRRSQRRSTKKSPYGTERSESSLVESVRLVRTALLSRLSRQGNAVVLITSAVPGTGKSHFTMTLGESFARAGKKVLMIDADLRKRTLTQRFNLFDKSGFMESLCSRSADKRNIFPTDTFGLSIMPAGERSNDGSVFEETANGAFKACMAQLREHYDIILLDSSPILPVADATILSGQVDGTIMVERELVSRRGSQIEALTRLVSSGGSLLGTVFVGSGDHKGYGYNYGNVSGTN